MVWVCGKCYSQMNVTREGKNRNRICCLNCGTEWYVDDNSEYLNYNSIDCCDDDE